MNKKAITFIVLSLLFSPFCYAQDDWEKGFEEFRKFQEAEYEDFYISSNEAFAKALKSAWEKFKVIAGDSKQLAEPKELPYVQPSDTVLESVEINIDEAEMRHQTAKNPEVTDSPVMTEVQSKNICFNFYGKPLNVAVPSEYGHFHPEGIKEKHVGEFWSELSSYNYNIITSRFLKYKFEMNLNDWSTYKWAESLSKAVFPENINDEQIIFTVFLLNQIGLLSNIARIDGKLSCIFAASQQIYAKPYTVIEEQKFYITGDCENAEDIYTYNVEPCRSLHTFDLNIYKPIRLSAQDELKTVVRHSDILSTDLTIPLYDSMLAYYDEYPQTDVNIYAAAVPEVTFAEAIKSKLKPFLEGKTNQEILNIFLNFLQKDFQYQTDQQQFGKEKPFFCEENFFYPANDCEDRSILFCFLVKQFLGSDFILLQYDNHIDCAVCLDEEITGYYVRRGEKKYYICDPTFIGAKVGMSSQSRKKPEKIWFF